LRAKSAAGFTLIEAIISISVLAIAMTAVSGMMVESAKINKSAQMAAETQANARRAMSVVVKTLRRAGWDPKRAGIGTVALDPDPTDDFSQIEVFADLDQDMTTNGLDEQVLIRHTGNRIEWRRTAGGSFQVLAEGISNDADVDGLIEPMFVPVPNPDPTRIQVQITARSRYLDPVTRQFLRFTVHSDVVLRKSLWP